MCTFLRSFRLLLWLLINVIFNSVFFTFVETKGKTLEEIGEMFGDEAMPVFEEQPRSETMRRVNNVDDVNHKNEL